MGKIIDLRPYMIEKPYCVYENDKLQKIVEVFRLMNLRHLPVIDEKNNTLVGMITR
jgi:CBS domain-containing protein